MTSSEAERALSVIMPSALYPEIDAADRSNFLYFWPPNQLVIFALGFILYNLIKNPWVRQRIQASSITADRASVLLLIVTFVLSFYGIRKFFEWERALAPTHLLMTICFVPWALVLILKPTGYAINSAIMGLGKVSFSAYVLHFAVLGYAGNFLRKIWPLEMTGVASISFEVTLLVVAVVITRILGELTYRCIEQPFIHIGKSITRNIHARQANRPVQILRFMSVTPDDARTLCWKDRSGL